MLDIAYDFHHNRMEIDLFAKVNEEDVAELIEIAKQNGCSSVVKWVDKGVCKVLWEDKNERT